MFRWIALSVCVTASFGQSPGDLFNRPPADVDRALRSRVTEFYQDHVEGKYRQAEALVAEDTKDYFYITNKPKYVSFELQGIEYSDGFTRARANVIVEQYLPLPYFANTPLKLASPSTWKLVDGQWFWYVDQSSIRETPFGKLRPGASPPPGSVTASLPPSIPTLKDMSFIFTQVKADKTTVTLKGEETERITITNTAQGGMNLSLMEVPPGIDAKLDKDNLGAGEKAVLTLRAGKGAQPGVIHVRVEQTNQVIAIQAGIQ
jgi:hypothetical protein